MPWILCIIVVQLTCLYIETTMAHFYKTPNNQQEHEFFANYRIRGMDYQQPEVFQRKYKRQLHN